MARRKRRKAVPELWKLEPKKIRLHMQHRGLNQSRLCEKAGLSRHTVIKLLKGQGVYPTTAKVIADFFSVDVEELLAMNVVTDDGTGQRLPRHPEWDIVNGTVGPLHQTNSNLFYRTCKLQHRHLREEYGRGKLYDLLGVADLTRERMVEQLTRHAEVCRSLRHVRQVVENLSVTEVDSGNAWWVVDQWIGGKPLSEVLAAGIDWSLETLYGVMLQILTAVSEMHEHNIIFRELAPQRVLISPQLDVFLTDLELAKLLDHSGTVSMKWDNDDYRAPEIEEGEALPQADFYSWARIFTRLLLKTHSDDLVDTRNAFFESGINDNHSKILCACLSPDWKKRPESASTILAELV